MSDGGVSRSKRIRTEQSMCRERHEDLAGHRARLARRERRARTNLTRVLVTPAESGYTNSVSDPLSVVQARYAMCANYEDRGVSLTNSTY